MNGTSLFVEGTFFEYYPVIEDVVTLVAAPKQKTTCRTRLDRWRNAICRVVKLPLMYVIFQISSKLKCREPAEDLVLGTAVGYNVDEMRPFVRSLKGTGYRGRIVLLMDDPWNATAKLLQREGIETLPYLPDRSSVTNRRCILYRDFLYHQKHLKRVMITDVRDVVFQKCPFESVRENRLYCFEEDPATILSESSVNSGWIKQMYGEEVLSTIGHNPILCAGVTAGGYIAMIRYIDCICAEPAARPVVWGSDQAALNMLVYTGRMPETIVVPNEEGPVYTLHLVRPQKIRFSTEGLVLNQAGIPSVIHQYDRHPVLVAWVNNRFASRMDSFGGPPSETDLLTDNS